MAPSSADAGGGTRGPAKAAGGAVATDSVAPASMDGPAGAGDAADAVGAAGAGGPPASTAGGPA
ncbi:MAG: endoglucanase, partial [Myxococcota bacterium]|nr:endoglucanase [Myxococcota bacterium]